MAIRGGGSYGGGGNVDGGLGIRGDGSGNGVALKATMLVMRMASVVENKPRGALGISGEAGAGARR